MYFHDEPSSFPVFPDLMLARVGKHLVYKGWESSIFPYPGFKSGIGEFQENKYKSVCI